jgi:hypothetical protein
MFSAQEDVQEERTVWTGLIPIDVGKAPTVEAGKNSREKEIQKARQMIVKATIYGGYNVYVLNRSVILLVFS